MSEPAPTNRPAANYNGIRSRLQHIRVARERRIVGPAEIVALGGSVLLAVLVVVSYLYFLVPAKSRLGAAESERLRLENQLRVSRELATQGQTTEMAVQKITQSLGDFESDQLLTADRGRMGIYNNLNVLILKNGLRNTSGPTYLPLEPSDSKVGANGSRSTSTKWQSIYPGIAISVTVEGAYQNLRRFIRDLETNKQFIIINSVELERSNESNNSLAEGDTASGGTRGTLVSLRLEMTTYFKRGSAQDAADEAAAR
ncbi:MAG TPA: GspMb/PilO family protein [Pyrinomonadaceae bacterium]|nr:GspMb/PilO family protein [Pyrinomonadaceae bacterium]